MSKKQYTVSRIIIAMLLAGVVSFSVANGNFIIPIFAVAASMAFLIILRRSVREVLADERDYQVAGNAARWTISIYAGLAFLLSMLSFALKEMQPDFTMIGSVFAYSACAVMLLYSLIFTAMDKSDKHARGRFWFILMIIVASLLFAVVGLRIISGEDTWLCQDGKWVAHGHPAEPQPNNPCEK